MGKEKSASDLYDGRSFFIVLVTTIRAMMEGFYVARMSIVTRKYDTLIQSLGCGERRRNTLAVSRL